MAHKRLDRQSGNSQARLGTRKKEREKEGEKEREREKKREARMGSAKGKPAFSLRPFSSPSAAAAGFNNDWF